MTQTGLSPETLGEALCLLRRRAGISRNDLAAASGISGGALSTYENDASMPSAAVLRRLTRALADCLELDVMDLWGPFGLLLDSPLRSRSHPDPGQGNQLIQKLTSTD